MSRPRFLAQLLGIFAVVALALAAIGTYGVLAYSVAARRRELGIRMALGSSQQGLLSLVLGQGMGLALLGLMAGLLGALAVTRLASSLLFGVKPADRRVAGDAFGGVHRLRDRSQVAPMLAATGVVSRFTIGVQ